MGIVYMLVDYGIFHLLLHSRGISEGNSLFWVLLWMSMSYGFTNFTWIWLWISRDEHLFEWSLLILGWWFCCPLITQTFAGEAVPIVIERTTGAYHGYMAVILFVGYLGLILYNMYQTDRAKRIRIPWLLAIGILVQFGWKAGSDRRNPQRGLFGYRAEAACAVGQFHVGNQSGLAVYLLHLYSVFEKIHEEPAPQEPSGVICRED